MEEKWITLSNILRKTLLIKNLIIHMKDMILVADILRARE
jgi:hypothetical protein